MGSPTARRQSAHWSLQWRRRSRPKVEESTSTFCSTNHGIAVMPRFYFDIRKGVRFSVDMPQARQVDRPDKQRRRKWDCDHRISVAAGQVRTGRHRKPETSHAHRSRRFLLSLHAGGDDRSGRQPGRAARAGRGRRAGGLGRMRGLAPRLDRRLRHADVARRLQAGVGLGAGRARSKRPRTSRAWRRQSPTTAWICCRRAHTWSGVEMALWDLLGKARGEPVWRLLGYPVLAQEGPYASMLFGDTPQETLERARRARAEGFRAGKVRLGSDRARQRGGRRDHFAAAREGLGTDGIAARRCGPDLRRGRRGRRRAPAGSRGGTRHCGSRSRSGASAYEAYAALRGG